MNLPKWLKILKGNKKLTLKKSKTLATKLNKSKTKLNVNKEKNMNNHKKKCFN